MQKGMPLIVTIGEILWDLLPTGRCLGGAPGNFAYHATQQGARAYTVSAVGNDQEGKDIISTLEDKGLSTDYLATVQNYPTGSVSVELEDGIPNYNIHAPVAWDYIPFEDKLIELANKADAVCFGTLAQRSEISSATIKRFLANTRSDCLKVFDVNLRQNFFNYEILTTSLSECDLLKISDEELPVIASLLDLSGSKESMIVELTKCHGFKSLVFTQGKDGSIFYDGENFISISAHEYGPMVDTVGCGDSFTATLTVGLLWGITPGKAMRHASKIAGLVCASNGAMPKIPENMKFNKNYD